MDVRSAITPQVPGPTPGVVEYVQVTRGVFAEPDYPGEPLSADLSLYSGRSVEVTSLGSKRTSQEWSARYVIYLDVHVWALIADHKLRVGRIKVQRTGARA